MPTHTTPILTIVVGAAATMFALGCGYDSAHTFSRDYGLTDRSVDPPDPHQDGSFEKNVTGGQLFAMYCSACHNGRPLGERNFRMTEVTFSHMRTQAYLTGTEYRKLVHYLRRWHELGAPVKEVEPSPKRFFFDQPIEELKPEEEAAPPRVELPEPEVAP